MNQQSPVRTSMTGQPVPAPRFAVVDHEKSWLKTPLNWRVRIWGQGIGGYARADGSVSRYGDKARAERAAQVWMDEGIYPGQQARAFVDLNCPHSKRRAFGAQAEGN